ASPSSWRRAAISRWSSRPSRRGRRRGRTGPAGFRWCACRRCPCPDTPASGSACPPAGCAPRWPGITPTWCIWPARSSSGPAAARLPVIAVYQTDVPAYARLYGTGPAGQAASWRRLRKIHNAAARTLAPSTATAADLQSHGIRRVWLWGRGVDTVRFDPARRSAPLRRALAPGGEVLAGYVGRLGAEKRVDRLAGVAALPGARLVIVGSGPAEAAARRAMPAALFLGQRQGDALASLTRAWTCSCTAARTRRSARPCRKRRQAACPWSLRLLAARSTWWTRVSPGSWCRRATAVRWPPRLAGW